MRPLSPEKAYRFSTPRQKLASHRFPVGRVGERLGAGLPEVRDHLLPHLAPEGMVSQALDLLVSRSG